MGLRISGKDVTGMRFNGVDAIEARFNGSVVWPEGDPESFILYVTIPKDKVGETFYTNFSDEYSQHSVFQSLDWGDGTVLTNFRPVSRLSHVYQYTGEFVVKYTPGEHWNFLPAGLGADGTTLFYTSISERSPITRAIVPYYISEIPNALFAGC